MHAAALDKLHRDGGFEPKQAIAIAEAIDIVVIETQLVTVPIMDSRFGAVTTRFTAMQTAIDAQFEDTRTVMDARFAAMQTAVDAQFVDVRTAMDARFTAAQYAVDAQFLDIRTAMDARFADTQAATDLRFAKVEGRFDLLEARIDTKLEGLKGSFELKLAGLKIQLIVTIVVACVATGPMGEKILNALLGHP
jgi:hypothetical protein